MKTILIIESDQMIREFTVDFLKNKGYTVLSSSNIKEGSEIAFERIPSIVVCNLSSVDSKEFELCKKLKTVDVTAKIPIIFITSLLKEVQFGIQIGADDFLEKPFSLSQLVEKINKNLLKSKN